MISVQLLIMNLKWCQNYTKKSAAKKWNRPTTVAVQGELLFFLYAKIIWKCAPKRPAHFSFGIVESCVTVLSLICIVTSVQILANMKKPNAIWMVKHLELERIFRMMICHIAEPLADALDVMKHQLKLNVPILNAQNYSIVTGAVYHNMMI